MIVLDASAAVAPHLVDVEVLSALRREADAGRLAADHAQHALIVWKRIGLIRYAATPLVDRVWELRKSVAAYDAVYVALAENLGCALVTADARLAGSHGPRCAVVVVPD